MIAARFLIIVAAVLLAVVLHMRGLVLESIFAVVLAVVFVAMDYVRDQQVIRMRRRLQAERAKRVLEAPLPSFARLHMKPIDISESILKNAVRHGRGGRL